MKELLAAVRGIPELPGRDRGGFDEQGLPAVRGIVNRTFDATSAIDPNRDDVAIASDCEEFILDVGFQLVVDQKLSDLILDIFA